MAMAALSVGAIGEAEALQEPLCEREEARSPRKAITAVARELV